jgi:membrane-bound lytic murein transglycosylase B
MKRSIIAMAAAVALFAIPASAQPGPGGAIVTTYRAAPGHQVQLLTWLARQDEINRAAGLPAAQLYVHLDGASWDYMIVAPQPTPAQDDAVEAASRRMGAATGPAVGIELRQHIAEHTDTIVSGPTTAADFLRRIHP